MTDQHRTHSSAVAEPLVFETPDGHVWERDVDHQAAPMAPFARARFIEAFNTGISRGFARVGAPIAGARACAVHGWLYLRFVPAGAPDKPGAGTPPDVILKVLSRLHPELRRRERTARHALADEVWMVDVETWWRERSTWERRFRTRQAVDPTALTDTELADEIEAAVEEAMGMLVRHFELITPAAGIGLAFLAGQEHGIEPTATAEALRGTSTSTAAPVRALREIRQLIDPQVLASATTVDELRSVSVEAADRIDAYLDEYGWRVLGDDVALPTLAESPDALVRSLQSTSTAEEHPVDAIGDLLDRVPTHDRARVEELLRKAGEGYEMLDDNSAMLCWGIGVLRRLVLAGAARLTESGVLDAPEQVWMLRSEEALDALRGGTPPTRGEIRDRQARHAAAAAVEPPDVLGGDPGTPPDPGVFPHGLRTISGAVGTYLALRFPKPDQRVETGRVDCDGSTVATGFGIGARAATGRAVVAQDAMDAMDRLEPGDVLVCPVTNPAYNALFPIAAAVVTAVGGPMGHTAVTAREVGIPAVVGIGDLGVITDGAEITVVGG